MVSISKKASLVIFFAAGSIFIGIGIASIADSNIPRFVEISEIIKPNQTGIFTPDMNTGNIANISFNKSDPSIVIKSPNNVVIMNKTQDNQIFNETIKAGNNGKYKIEITNTGNTESWFKFRSFFKGKSNSFQWWNDVNNNRNNHNRTRDENEKARLN